MLKITIRSFSYKRGFPYDQSGNGGGFVFDCRSIENPGRYDEYKKLSGLNAEVIEFLNNIEDMQYFLSDSYAMVSRATQKYIDREFTSLMICFGCTGGQHRSVYSAEFIAKKLKENYAVDIDLKHLEQGNWLR